MDAEGRVSYNCCAKVDLALVSLCLILHDSHRSSGAGAGAGAGGEGAYVLLSLSSIMSL